MLPGDVKPPCSRWWLLLYVLALGLFLVAFTGPDLLFAAGERRAPGALPTPPTAAVANAAASVAGPAAEATAPPPVPSAVRSPAAPPVAPSGATAAAADAAEVAAAAAQRTPPLAEPRYGDGGGRCDRGRANAACPGATAAPARPEPWTFGDGWMQPWRQSLGDRLLAVQGQLTEEQCDGFFSIGDYVWCNRAVEPSGGAPRPAGAPVVGISFGIRQRDPWSELMSNRYGFYTHLYDCFFGTTNDTTKGVIGWGKKSGDLAAQVVAGAERCPPIARHAGCYEAPYEIHRVCVSSIPHRKGRPHLSLAEVLAGRPPLSVHLKMDVEGSEWGQLQALVSSPEDVARIRTLDMEVHFNMEDWSRNAVCNKEEAVLEKVRIIEQLAEVFVLAGTTLRQTLQTQRSVAAGPAEKIQSSFELGVHEVHCVITSSGWDLDQYCLSFVNRQLLSA